MGPKDLAANARGLTALTLLIPTPSVDLVRLSLNYSMIRSARNILGVNALIEQTCYKERSRRLCQITIVNAELALHIITKGEDVTLLRHKATMLRTARNSDNEYFEAQTFGQIQSPFSIILIIAVAKLTLIIISPREKLSVAALNLLNVRALIIFLYHLGAANLAHGGIISHHLLLTVVVVVHVLIITLLILSQGGGLCIMAQTMLSFLYLLLEPLHAIIATMIVRGSILLLIVILLDLHLLLLILVVILFHFLPFVSM